MNISKIINSKITIRPTDRKIKKIKQELTQNGILPKNFLSKATKNIGKLV